jgi:hypothetical protein
MIIFPGGSARGCPPECVIRQDELLPGESWTLVLVAAHGAGRQQLGSGQAGRLPLVTG